MASKTTLTHQQLNGETATRTTARSYTHVVEFTHHVNDNRTAEEIYSDIPAGFNLTEEQKQERVQKALAKAEADKAQGSRVMSWHGSRKLADSAANTLIGRGFCGVTVREITPPAASATGTSTSKTGAARQTARKGKEATMASKTKTTQTNSNARKDAARKAGKCQLCGTKTKGHSVVIDYDKNKVVKSAAGKAKQGHAFYCTDCADKKVKRYEWKLARRNGTAKPKATKKATAKKAAPKGKAKAKPAAKKRTTPKAKATATPRKRSTPKAGGKAKAKAAAKGKASAPEGDDPF